MPHLIPVGYPGPTAPSQLKVYDWLKDIPTTKVYNTNKYQSPPVALKQLKGEWAPIVCRKVQDPEQTVLVTGESGEKTGVSAVVSNQPLVVPQQQYSGPEKSVVRSTNNQPTFSTNAPETGFQPSMTHSLTLTAQQSLNISLPQKSTPQSLSKLAQEANSQGTSPQSLPTKPEAYPQSTFFESLPTSTLTPEAYSQSTSSQPLPKLTYTKGPNPQRVPSQSVKLEPYAQGAFPKSLPTSTLTSENNPQSASSQPVPMSTHRSGPYYQKISSQSLSTSNLTQEAHLQTVPTQFSPMSTVPQESLQEAPGRIITHGRIAITGSTGIIP